MQFAPCPDNLTLGIDKLLVAVSVEVVVFRGRIEVDVVGRVGRKGADFEGYSGGSPYCCSIELPRNFRVKVRVALLKTKLVIVYAIGTQFGGCR